LIQSLDFTQVKSGLAKEKAPGFPGLFSFFG